MSRREIVRRELGWAEVLVGNVASARLLTRLGFVHEGTMASVAAGTCGDGSDRVDIELWARIADQRVAGRP